MNDSYDLPFSPERKQARRFDTPYRSRIMTDQVFTDEDLPEEARKAALRRFGESMEHFYPEKSKYRVFFGELHGHSCLSDGGPSPDDYYRNIRDVAKLDFAALTDHHHGGVGSSTLYGRKGEMLREAAVRRNEPGRFSTLFGYEIDGYPYYNNFIVYHRDHTGGIFREAVDGDITAAELKALLAREDRLVVPHDTYQLGSGADLSRIDPALFTPLIEIYSRDDCAEYFDHPFNHDGGGMVRGCCWQDALRRGAKMGCIAASDDHGLQNGLPFPSGGDPCRYPGITGVLCEENTTQAIFDALKARRCYGFMGGRMGIDFRINGHYMGEEFTSDGDRTICMRVDADAPVKKLTLVKNCEDALFIRKNKAVVLDYSADTPCDSYYLRVELTDGRLGWTSPIWVNCG
ncbi:MAG: DUF3604 domain-containing protein [Clostridia bacterium]|nr:DUF3604 domain-containing protein [Clostridia bacterium]